MTPQSLPPAGDLTRAQYSGWACCWCGVSLLRSGGTSAGIAQDRIGAHVLDIEVYACPACTSATTNTRPPTGASGTTPSHPRATVHDRRTL